ncbi:MAG: TIGR02594 family protein [Pseudomonadota bacterium]
MSKAFFQSISEKIQNIIAPPVYDPAPSPVSETTGTTTISAPITVQSGDTLSSLGEKHSFYYNDAQIIRNGQTYNIGYGPGEIHPNHIRPGDQIIPSGEAPTVDPIKKSEAAAEEQGSEQDVEETVAQCCLLPTWMPIALQEIGETEISGSNANARILEYFQASGFWGEDDSGAQNAWCGSFVAWVMKEAGYQLAKEPFRAKEWMNRWDEGVNIGRPIYGAIAVKSRRGGGHVGFVAGSIPGKSDKLAILGGNQGNQVNVGEYDENVFEAFMVPRNYAHSCCRLKDYTGNIGTVISEE